MSFPMKTSFVDPKSTYDFLFDHFPSSCTSFWGKQSPPFLSFFWFGALITLPKKNQKKTKKTEKTKKKKHFF